MDKDIPKGVVHGGLIEYTAGLVVGASRIDGLLVITGGRADYRGWVVSFE